MAELTGITLDGTETGIGHYAVSQCRLADTWWTVQKDCGRSTGSRRLDPGQKRRIVIAME